MARNTETKTENIESACAADETGVPAAVENAGPTGNTRVVEAAAGVAADGAGAEEANSRDEAAPATDGAAGKKTAPAQTACEEVALESLSALAARHRIAGWQQAALLRYMGWQDDRMVTDEDYRKALDGLKHRRIGGGRK